MPIPGLDELLNRARAYLAAGRFNEAKSVAAFLVQEIEPKRTEAHLILSKAEVAMGRIEAGLTEAAKAAALDPENETIRRQYLGCLGRLAMEPKVEPLLALGARILLDRVNQASGGGNASPPTATSVDLVVPMTAPAGAEMKAIETAKRLRRHVETTIWSPSRPHEALLELDPTIRIISADAYPSGDVLGIMGIFQRLGAWVQHARPRRIILNLNTFYMPGLLRWLGAATRLQVERVDVLFASRWLQKAVGADGVMLPSPIDIERFSVHRTIDAVRSIGRMSRDELSKHHPQDPDVYDKLLGMGLDVRIMGAGEVGPLLRANDHLTLMAEHTIPPEVFLHSIDLFFYRTGTWFEPWARVVSEAMACGLPTVCHRAGGYAEIIRHNENGFLFDSSEEAVEIITRLRSDAPTLARIGEAARQTIADLFSPESDARMVEFFAGR